MANGFARPRDSRAPHPCSITSTRAFFMPLSTLPLFPVSHSLTPSPPPPLPLFSFPKLQPQRGHLVPSAENGRAVSSPARETHPVQRGDRVGRSCGPERSRSEGARAQTRLPSSITADPAFLMACLTRPRRRSACTGRRQNHACWFTHQRVLMLLAPAARRVLQGKPQDGR